MPPHVPPRGPSGFGGSVGLGVLGWVLVGIYYYHGYFWTSSAAGPEPGKRKAASQLNGICHMPHDLPRKIPDTTESETEIETETPQSFICSTLPEGPAYELS